MNLHSNNLNFIVQLISDNLSILLYSQIHFSLIHDAGPLDHMKLHQFTLQRLN